MPVIHHQTEKLFPGECLWTAAQLVHPATVRFLRVHNREGCDVYIQPSAQTSRGKLQAWVQVSSTPIEPAVDSRIGKPLTKTSTPATRPVPIGVIFGATGAVKAKTTKSPRFPQI